MMIRNLLLAVLLLMSCNINAQVARWIIHPEYDYIKMLESGFYVASKNGRYGMLDDQEKVVVPMQYDSMSVFNSQKALLYEGGKCIGYVSDRGDLKNIAALQFDVVGLNSFSDGYLAVSNNSGYFYICANSDEKLGPYTYAAPFSEGYAWVKVPKSMKHVLDGSYTFQVLSAKTGEPVSLSLGEYEEDDIDFISSCCNGKSIIVLKKRFYEYEYKTGKLTPLATDDNPTNKKTRVTALERPVDVKGNGSGYTIRFKQGTMNFDGLMRLTSIAYEGQAPRLFEKPKVVIPAPQSNINGIRYNDNPLLGLAYDGKEVLPAQFDNVIMLRGNQALLRKNGKMGVLTIDPNAHFRFVLNDNRNIGFEHRLVNTDVRVICPPYMNPKLMTLSSADNDCVINADTRGESVNVEAAVLSYKCSLKIPEEIGSEQTSSSVKFVLNYDGLRYVPSTISFNTWYVNNYNVQLLSHQVAGAALNVELLVKNNSRYEGGNYFFDVKIVAADSITCTYKRLNEELYEAHFYRWTEDVVKFSVDITEEGCPTISYSYSIPVKSGNTSKKEKAKSESTEADYQSQGQVKRKAVRPKTPAKKEDSKIILIPN